MGNGSVIPLLLIPKPLAEGAEFRLVERPGDWLLIRMPGGQEGWLEKEAVALY